MITKQINAFQWGTRHGIKINAFNIIWVQACIQSHGVTTTTTKPTYKFTMNGWFISVNMPFSFFTCSTCLSLITSDIAKIFIAQYLFVFRSKHKQTRPNVPVPRLCIEGYRKERERKKMNNVLSNETTTSKHFKCVKHFGTQTEAINKKKRINSTWNLSTVFRSSSSSSLFYSPHI